MYVEKCAREFDTIAHTLFRDLFVLGGSDGVVYSHDLNRLLEDYAAYYRQHNIRFNATYMPLHEQGHIIQANMEISFVYQEGEHYIHIVGVLQEPFSSFRLDYYYSMTENLAQMRSMQNILLLICIAFSIITACVLYIVLSRIFKPLSIVSKASEKIADGDYNERIYIKGENEISLVAKNFNRMAQEIQAQIQLLEEESDAKQRFIDNFAHEIRTPLTSIYGNAEYMQRALLEEGEVIEYAQFIMDKASYMKQIANSLLQLATLRNYKPVKTKIQIQYLFDDIKSTVSKNANEQKLKFICEGDADTLYAQEDLIKSLLLNLCFNSFKACTANEGIIHLKAKSQNGHIELSVADNGCGIPEKSLSKVIEPFYQVSSSRSQGHTGAGLGLTLCKQIAEVHGAKMFIESVVGEGTSVKILFTTP